MPTKLICDLCGKKETPPYDEGDECYCGGVFRVENNQPRNTMALIDSLKRDEGRYPK